MSPRKRIRKNTNESSNDYVSETAHCSSKSPTKTIKLSPRKTTNSPNNDEQLSILMKKIVDILGQIYFNSTERLQIDCVPKCMENLENCSTNHFKNGLIFNEADQSLITKAEHFVQTDCLVLLIRLISNLLTRNRFPGAKILLIMIDMILVSCFSDNLK